MSRNLNPVFTLGHILIHRVKWFLYLNLYQNCMVLDLTPLETFSTKIIFLIVLLNWFIYGHKKTKKARSIETLTFTSFVDRKLPYIWVISNFLISFWISRFQLVLYHLYLMKMYSLFQNIDFSVYSRLNQKMTSRNIWGN